MIDAGHTTSIIIRTILINIESVSCAMQTIIDLVSEIRWHKSRDPSEYTLGYWDRVIKEIKWIKFEDIDFDESDKFALVIIDPDGRRRHVPYHRFRRVKKGDALMWKRDVEENVKK